MDTDETKTTLEVQQAFKLPRLKALPRMKKEAMVTLMMLYAQGYTARVIANKMLAEHGVTLSDSQVLTGGVLYSDQVEEIRKQLAEKELTSGLARRSERVRRLKVLAEQYEDKAENDTKAAGVFLKTLDQIGDEMLEVGLKEDLEQEDPWFKLLGRMRTQAKVPPLLPGPEESEGASHPAKKPST